MLIAKYESSTNYYFNFQSKKIYTLFDSVHLITNIRNNLLNAKVFVFPEFNFEDFEDNIHVSGGEIRWQLLHRVHEKDSKSEKII